MSSDVFPPADVHTARYQLYRVFCLCSIIGKPTEQLAPCLHKPDCSKDVLGAAHLHVLNCLPLVQRRGRLPTQVSSRTAQRKLHSAHLPHQRTRHEYTPCIHDLITKYWMYIYFNHSP